MMTEIILDSLKFIGFPIICTDVALPEISKSYFLFKPWWLLLFHFFLLQEHQISVGWISSLSSTHPLLFAIASKFCKLPSVRYLTWCSSVLFLLLSRTHIDSSITVLLYYFLILLFRHRRWFLSSLVSYFFFHLFFA